jgi:hypothetical protein
LVKRPNVGTVCINDFITSSLDIFIRLSHKLFLWFDTVVEWIFLQIWLRSLKEMNLFLILGFFGTGYFSKCLISVSLGFTFFLPVLSTKVAIA